MNARLPLRKDRLFLLAGAMTAIMLVVSVAHDQAVRGINERSAAQTRLQQEEYLLALAHTVAEDLQEVYFDLQDLASSPPSVNHDFSAINRAIAQWVDHHAGRHVASMFTIDRNGNLTGIQPPDSVHDLGLPAHLLTAKRHWLDLGDSLQLLHGEARTYLQMYQPITSKERIEGYLCLILDLSGMLKDVCRTSPGGGSFFALLDNETSILLPADRRYRDSSLAALLPAGLSGQKELRGAIASGELGSQIVSLGSPQGAGHDQAVSDRTDRVLLSMAPVRLPGKTWSLAYTLPAEVLETVSPNAVFLTMSLLLAWICTLLLYPAAWSGRRQRLAADRREAGLRKDLQLLRSERAAYCSRYEQLMHNANEALFFINMDSGQLLEINRQAEEMLGYRCEDVVNLSLRVLFPGPRRQQYLRLLARVRRHGKAEEPEMPFRRRDGSLFIGAIKVKTAEFEGRQLAIGSFRDVTSGVKLEAELRRHNRRLSLLNEISQRVAEGHDLQTTLKIILDHVVDSLDVSGGGIFLIHHQGTEMHLAIHRAIPHNVLKDLNHLNPGEGLAGSVAATGRPKLSTNLRNDYRRISTTVVEDGWQAFLAVPMIADEVPLGVIFIFDRNNRVLNREDVRLMQAIGRQVGPLVKNAELFDELQWQHRINQASMRELERSRSALSENLEQLDHHHRMLQSLDQMKSTFLALASHELRTPLTTILSGAEFLQATAGQAPDSDSARALAGILQGGQRLKMIIDDLLEAARLEARSLYLAREVIAPRPLIEAIIDDHSEALTARELTCSCHAFPADIAIRGDYHHLQKALGRLLENAVKFTPGGGMIEIGGKVRSREEILAEIDLLKPFSKAFFEGPSADRYLEISIRDTGIGIDAREHVRIFDKFYEVGDIASHTTSKAGFGGKGVGIGLTLVKGVVEAHDGLIWVASDGENQGSCFSVVLPLAETGGATDGGH